MEKHNFHGNELDLSYFVMVLIRKKWLIISGTFIFTIVAVIYSFSLPRVYRSKGFFRFPEKSCEQVKMETGIERRILIPDYKRYLSLFTDRQRFIIFVVSKGYFKGKDLDEIKKSTAISFNLAKEIKPIFSFSKKDIREFGKVSKMTENCVRGVQLSGEKFSPEKAQKFVKIVGLFIKNCTLYMKLNDYIIAEFNNSQTGVNKYKNEIIKSEFKLDQLYKKLQKKKALLKKYPQSKTFGNRELVSVEKGGDRFLSPIAQLVGIESEIIDIKEQLAHLNREKDLMSFKFNFFSKAKDILNKGIFGEALLNRIIKLKVDIFKKKNCTVSIVKQLLNELTIDFDNFISIKDEMKFVSGPTFPKTLLKTNKKLIIIIVFFMALFFFIFIAFFLEWWKQNRKESPFFST